MSSYKKIVRFCGSALFAAILLSTTALFVAFGTFLESKTGSHLFAMETVYSSLLFRILLTCFFINILVSALLRYPFKLKHIPFLITHIGLLMVISGLLVKSFLGLQGNVTVPAGSEKSIAYIPEQNALIIETKDKKRFEFLLSKDFFGNWDLKEKKELYFNQDKPKETIDVRLLGSSPHSQLVIDTFFKGNFVDIEGLLPLPVFSWKKGDSFTLSGKIRMPSNEGVFNVIAIKTPDAEVAISSLIEQATAPFKTKLLQKIALYREPTILFIQDENQEVHIAGIDEKARVNKISLGKRCEGSQLLSYDDGFSGFGVQVPFPCTLYDDQEPLPISQSLSSLFLNTLSDAGRFTYERDVPLSISLQEALQESTYFEEREELAKSLALASLLLDDVLANDVGSESLSEAFKKRDLPFLRRISFIDEKDDALFLANLVEMMFSLEQFCPLSEMTVSHKAKLTSLLLRIYQKKPLETKRFLETKLAMQWKKDLGLSVKAEDLAPLLLLEISHDRKKERVVAGLDLDGKGFTNCCLDGNGKIYLSPLSYEIPWSVRVQDAREFSYPGTNQAEEYECSFYLTDRRTGDVSLKHIGMNRVFETDDGYRFFLSNIHPSDESAPQIVRLALNYDPSRRLFIVFGSILVALGIVLLYFFVMRKNKR